ncbi:ERAD-associated protein [Pseudocyphellaria aurata]|nr:ERAD-associated protein [Pseudocyphellaria aurata]
MSPSPSSKRRRLNISSSKLSQPFKSPFKTPLKPSPTEAATPSPTPKSTPVYPAASTILPLPKSDHPVIARATATPRTRGIPVPPSPQLAQLQKRHTALLGTLASARASLETHAQALKLETSSTDRELEGLVAKWKGVSREAAEEVFAVVAARVEGMGGVKGWRQKEREKREGFLGGGGWGWEEEYGDRKGEDEGGGDERDDRGAEEKEQTKAQEPEDDSEETFTMSMMLRSLNVDFQLIGYDPEAQKWLD